jgi:hypothetical protein
MSARNENQKARWNHNDDADLDALMDPRADAPEAEVAQMKAQFKGALKLMAVDLGVRNMGVSVIVHRSAKRAGDYQVTYLQHDEPIGDWQARDLDTALYIARETNFKMEAA